jgi:hypothetical protein
VALMRTSFLEISSAGTFIFVNLPSPGRGNPPLVGGRQRC